MNALTLSRALGFLSAVTSAACNSTSTVPVAPSVPVMGKCWTVADVPSLGADFDNIPGQQPVDFAIWPAADGTWQLWSCIRGTKEEGNTRLFHRWEGLGLDEASGPFVPKGIAMRAGRAQPVGVPNDGQFDASFGEEPGGLQAPYVWRDGSVWRMVYGTWGNLGEQVSTDGKTFARVPRTGSDVRIFSASADGTRDPMLLPVGGTNYLYFTANSGSVYVSTSTDGTNFSAPKEVAYGGNAGTGGSDAECPFVVRRDDGYFYLFRTTQGNAPCNYCPGVTTYVYASTDPTDFGINDDSKLIAELPIAAPEIHTVNGVDYIARLLESVQGIQVCELRWQASR